MVESPHAWQGFTHVQQDYNDFPQYAIAPQTYDSPPMVQSGSEYYAYSPEYTSPEGMTNVPVPDLTYSWQNFMSQFKA